MSLAMPAILAARSWTMLLVVGRVVGDVAGAVLLLDAADAVHQARACRAWPSGRASVSGSRR